MSTALELQAGRELDALIAEKVMRWVAIRRETNPKTGGLWLTGLPPHAAEHADVFKDRGMRGYDIPKFTTDIAAAWQVVEKLASRGIRLVLEDWRNDPRIAEPYQDSWAALFNLPDGHDTGQVVGADACLAICRAALRTVEVV